MLLASDGVWPGPPSATRCHLGFTLLFASNKCINWLSSSATMSVLCTRSACNQEACSACSDMEVIQHFEARHDYTNFASVGLRCRCIYLYGKGSWFAWSPMCLVNTCNAVRHCTTPTSSRCMCKCVCTALASRALFDKGQQPCKQSCTLDWP